MCQEFATFWGREANRCLRASEKAGNRGPLKHRALCKCRARTPGPSPCARAPAGCSARPPSAAPGPPRGPRQSPCLSFVSALRAAQGHRPRKAWGRGTRGSGRVTVAVPARVSDPKSGVFPLPAASRGGRPAPRAEGGIVRRARWGPSRAPAGTAARRGLGRSFSPAPDPPAGRAEQAPQLIHPRPADPARPQFPHLRGGGAHLRGGHMPRGAPRVTRPARAPSRPVSPEPDAGGPEGQTLPRPSGPGVGWAPAQSRACAAAPPRARDLAPPPWAELRLRARRFSAAAGGRAQSQRRAPSPAAGGARSRVSGSSFVQSLGAETLDP